MKVSVFPTKIKLCLGVLRGVIVFVFSLMLMVMACSVPGANAAAITVSSLNHSGAGFLRQAITDAEPDVGAYEYRSAVQTLPISLTLNKSSYTVDDPLNVDVTLANPGSQLTVDVYFGVLLPASSGPSFGCPQGDAVLFFSNGMTGASVVCASDPIQSFPRTFKGVVIPAGIPATSAKNFLSAVWLQGAPAGEYQIFMVLTRANALLDGTVDPGDVVGEATATMLFSP